MSDVTALGAADAALTIVLATHNRGKLHELGALLAGLPIQLVPIDAVLPNRPPVVEDGATLEDNALLKARAAASATMLVSIADDSGLEVDALGGRPGVRSARFAKEGATDAENNAALLAALDEVEDGQRTARFRCVLALVDPFADVDEPIFADGRCEGAITRQASGTGGFGYDPLFVVSGYDRTMAELTDAEKNAVSHRAKAVLALRPRVAELVAARLASAARVLG